MKALLLVGIACMSLCGIVLPGLPGLGQEAGKPGQLALFEDGKLWTFHLTIGAKEWAAMQPARGPMFGFPGFPGAKKEPQQPRPEDRPKGDEAKADDKNRADKANADKVKADDKNKVVGAFGLEFTYVQADLEFEGKTYKNVAVRFKGNSSYMSAGPGLKRPFKIDINRFVPGQTFHGTAMLNLANNAFDPTQLRESLSYAVFRAAGVPAPRTAFVQLQLTIPGKHEREYVGLYTLIENVDKRFLRTHFQDDRGMLLKPEKIMGLSYLGENWKPYAERFQPRREPPAAAKSRLIDFTKLVNFSDDATFRRRIGEFIDVEAFLRFVAVNSLLANVDSFQGLGHNYYLYLHPKTNKFLWIPWDLNMSFGGFPMVSQADQIEWSIRQPYLGKNRLIERVLAMAEHDKAYRAILKDITAKTFSPAKVHAEIEALEKLVKDALAKEPKPKGLGMFPMPGFGPRVPDLRQFVSKRVDSVTAQLEGKSEGKVMQNLMFMGKGPGGKGGFPGPGMFLAKPILKAADSDGDGKLSLEETRAGARRLFVAAGGDQDTAIEASALADAVDKLLPPPPGLGNFPKGKDGPKDIEKGKDPSKGPMSMGPGKRTVAAILKLAAADKEQKITLEKLLAATDTLFRQSDKDKNGTLEEKEITDGINGLIGPPPGFGPPGFGPPGFGPPGFGPPGFGPPRGFGPPDAARPPEPIGPPKKDDGVRKDGGR